MPNSLNFNKSGKQLRMGVPSDSRSEPIMERWSKEYTRFAERGYPAR
jgi:hypothetical protein